MWNINLLGCFLTRGYLKMRARVENKIINILTICALMASTMPTFAVNAIFPLNQRRLGGYSVYSYGAPSGFAADITKSPHPASSHLHPLEKGNFSSPFGQKGVVNETLKIKLCKQM